MRAILHTDTTKTEIDIKDIEEISSVDLFSGESLVLVHTKNKTMECDYITFKI